MKETPLPLIVSAMSALGLSLAGAEAREHRPQR